MRRAMMLLVLVSATIPSLGHAQARADTRRARPPAAAATSSAPPHAWLFGIWTGGLFPVLQGMAAQDCRTQPTVVFARDTVGHASLLGTAMIPRVIETARTTPAGAEFRFTPVEEGVDAGFGCADANALAVAREDANTITFPNCAGFPYPLERCPAT